MKHLKKLIIFNLSLFAFISSSFASNAVHPFPNGRMLSGDRCHFGTTNCAGNGYHLGVDLMGVEGSQVNSMCSGTVKHNNTDAGDVWNSKVIVEHDCNGKILYGIYGHILSNLSVGSFIGVGKPIGKIGKLTYNGADNSHLHMGVGLKYMTVDWGYGNQSSLSNYMDFQDVIAENSISQPLSKNPAFDGTGSLIDPTNCSGEGWGCSHDDVILHSHPNQVSAGFFQVVRVAGACEAVQLKGLAKADIEVRSWDGYGTDSKYYHVEDMENSYAIIPLINTKWNLVGVKTTSAIGTGSTRPLSAACVTGSGMSYNVSEKSGTPMKFDLDYSWGGNGSIISHAQNGDYGKIMDEVVLLRDKNTLAAIQVTKSAQCSTVQFNTFNTSGGFHLSWKKWDEKDWHDDQIINNGQSYPLPNGDWLLLKIKAEATGQNGSYIQAVCY